VSQAQNQPSWQEEFKRMWINHDKWKLNFKYKHIKTKNNKKTNTQGAKHNFYGILFLKHGKTKQGYLVKSYFKLMLNKLKVMKSHLYL